MIVGRRAISSTFPNSRGRPAGRHARAMVVTAVEHWRRALDAWRIPQPILDQASESPWVLPSEVFIRRADAQLANPIGATFRRAGAALAQLGPVPNVDTHAVAETDATADVPDGVAFGVGTVLDVGAAAGATSLPLAAAGLVAHLTAVDADSALLDACAARAAWLDVPFERIEGRWPDFADRAPVVDVVLCGNVLYNVADLAPFVAALADHARHLVIAEVAVRHPLTELNPLWERFHGVARPDGPGLEDLIAALDELGIQPDVTRWTRPLEAEYATFAELVEVTRRRLCLPPSAAADVDRALRDLGHSPDLPPDLGSSGRELATLSWPGTAA